MFLETLTHRNLDSTTNVYKPLENMAKAILCVGKYPFFRVQTVGQNIAKNMSRILEGIQKLEGVAKFIADPPPADSNTIHSKVVGQDKQNCLDGIPYLAGPAKPL